MASVERGAYPSSAYKQVAGAKQVPISSARKELINNNSFIGKAGKWVKYCLYWEKLVMWNGWTDDIAADAVMLTASGDASVYIHSLSNFKNFSHAGLLYRG